MSFVLRRRLRIARHRAVRWFGEPIAIAMRRRREQAQLERVLAVWRYDFAEPPAPHYARLERATKYVA